MFCVLTYGPSLKVFHVHLRRMYILHLGRMFYINLLSSSGLMFQLGLIFPCWLSVWIIIHWCKLDVKVVYNYFVAFNFSFMSINNCFIYFGASILGACIIIIMSSWWIVHFLSLCSVYFCFLLSFFLEICFVWYEYGYPYFFWAAICLENHLYFLHFDLEWVCLKSLNESSGISL